MRFYVNIDHVATVRQARRTDEPDPVRAAVLVELAGADGITVHLREDRRHIQDRDVRMLMETVRTCVNLEMATSEPILDLALELRPLQVTLVPEKREEVTTEGGLDLGSIAAQERVGRAVAKLNAAGIHTSLFIDPTIPALVASRDLEAKAVELHTGEYANASRAGREAELDRLVTAAHEGRAIGLSVHAGHGLTYENVVPVAAIPEIEELNIGHSIVSRALFVGMERAVREMRTLLREARVS
ncbi:MAG: pyridoxine 5'-phosphate synthase [Gemmatimonadota bacterium]